MARVVARAPGRVNLLGEHTDYAGGLCLPVAIDRYVEAEAERRPSGVRIETSFGSLEAERVGPCEPRWANLVMGCAAALGIDGGFSLRAGGDLPAGQGLGSSGAYTVAVTAALAKLFGLRGVDLVAVAREGEHRTGVRCGILDQSASALCRAGHALLLRPDGHEHVPFDGRIAVIHTGIDHDLVRSGYNDRVREWEEGSRLRREGRSPLPPTLARRLEHVDRENERVLRGAAALRAGDLRGFGRLMLESHESLSRLCEVSTPALDAAVDAARRAGAWGAKLTGAGFGGSVVALLEPGARLPFDGALECRAVDGVSVRSTAIPT
jgi:galactokinase